MTPKQMLPGVGPGAADYVKADAFGRFGDDAQRLSDAVALHLAGGGMDVVGRWVAARLSDGSSDGRTYDSKAEAVRFQLHEQQCAYVVITPDGMSPRAAAVLLKFTRQCYKAGLRPADPDFMMARIP